jgi:hypothetical protein
MQVWTTIMVNWLMPFVFVISGASLYYALGSRGAWKFIEDKIKRLFVPLIVGIFTHIMFQVYLERLTHRQFSGSFWEFIPHYFDGMYGYGGNFAWMGLHLWYLLILFVFSLICYPLLRWLKDGFGKSLLNRTGNLLALRGAVYTLALPVAWLAATLDPRTDWGMKDFGGWSLIIYLLFFLYGFIVISHEGMQRSIQKVRWLSLTLGVAGILSLLNLWATQGDPMFGSARYVQVFSIFGAASWCWILTFLGFGFKHFTQSRPLLAYATEAILPFYILHQTVLLCVGYFVVQWNIPDAVKYVGISMSSFVIIILTYEFLIRRVNVMRFLFGMKVKAKGQVASSKVTSQIRLKV